MRLFIFEAEIVDVIAAASFAMPWRHNSSLAEIGRIDRTDDGAVDVTDIDFLLLVW
jgi:hypothetical protein